MSCYKYNIYVFTISNALSEEMRLKLVKVNIKMNSQGFVFQMF